MEGYTIDMLLHEVSKQVHEIAVRCGTNSVEVLAELSNQADRITGDEPYVYVLDANGVMLVHGVNQDSVGREFYEVTDIDGKMFIKEIVDKANEQGSGWVEYKWLDPGTKSDRPKTVYFEKTNGLIICSGVYGADPASSILESPLAAEEIPLSGTGASIAGMSAVESRVRDDGENEGRLVPDDATRMVNKAVAFYRVNDKGAALAEFSNSHGLFTKGEQYIFALDSTGVMLAHGINEEYIGKDFYRVKDSEGKMFIKEIVDRANEQGAGWVEYRWFDPVTKKEQYKTVYFEKSNGTIICSGIYRY